MAGLILPHRWTRQPQGPVEINWSHPLARGLISYTLYTTGRDLCRVVTPVAAVPGNSTGAGGRGVKGDAATTLPDLSAYLGDRTYGVMLQNGTTADQGFGDWGTDPGQEHYPYAGQCYLSGGVGTSRFFTWSIGNEVLQPHCIVFSHRPALTIEYAYSFGRLRTTVGSADGAMKSPATLGAAGTWAYSGRFYGFFAHNRALTEAEACAMTLAPYQVLRPYSRRFYISTASAAQTVEVGLTTETDSAFAVGKSKLRLVGLNTEADSALALLAQKAKAIGLTSETDSSLTAGRAKLRVVGLNTETDEALPLRTTIVQPVGLATETDSALSAGRSKALAVGLASEADSALAALSRKLKAIGQATETASALAATRVKAYLVGLASTTASAFGVSKLKARLVGLATETDSSLGVTGGAPPTGPTYVLVYPLISNLVRTLLQRARTRTHKLFWDSN